VATFLGRRLAYTYEVREMVADERLVMRTAEGPFPMETTYTWEDAAEGRTNMTLRNRGEPSGSFKLLGPVMAARDPTREPEGPRPTQDHLGSRTATLTTAHSDPSRDGKTPFATSDDTQGSALHG
jgi:hypothetical protein